MKKYLLALFVFGILFFASSNQSVNATACYPNTGTTGCWVGPGVGFNPVDKTTCTDNHYTDCGTAFCTGPLNDTSRVYSCSSSLATPPPNSCPAECRQGTACGTGYSASTGCTGSGVGGGCTINQVCCKNNTPPNCGTVVAPICVQSCTRINNECRNISTCYGAGTTIGASCGVNIKTNEQKVLCSYDSCTTVCTTPTPTPVVKPIITPIPTPVPTLTPSPSPTPTLTPIVAQCVSTRIYSPNWIQITNADYSNLLDNSNVYFCVAGSSTGGSFDMARFTINGVLYPSTAVMRPGSSDFCQLYTIPSGIYTTTVQGEVHHNTLGWL